MIDAIVDAKPTITIRYSIILRGIKLSHYSISCVYIHIYILLVIITGDEISESIYVFSYFTFPTEMGPFVVNC